MNTSANPIMVWLSHVCEAIVASVDSVSFDPREPETSKQRLEADIERRSASLPSFPTIKEIAQTIVSLNSGTLLDMIEAQQAKDGKELATQVQADPRAAQLLALAGTPSTPQFYLALHTWAETPDDAEHSEKALLALAELPGLSHERSATRAVGALHAVIEGPYQLMLRKLVDHQLLCARKITFPATNLGTLLLQAKTLLAGSPLLIELDAARIRNAPAHLGWKYRPSDGFLVLKDKGKAPLELSLDEWIVKASSLYELSTRVFSRVRQLLAIKRWQEIGLANHVAQGLEALRRGDQDWLRQIFQELIRQDAHMKSAAELIHQRAIRHEEAQRKSRLAREIQKKKAREEAASNKARKRAARGQTKMGPKDAG